MWPFDNKQKQFIQEMSKGAEWTPDLPALLTSPEQLLFACDDLMSAHQKHTNIAEQSQRVARGFTRNKFDYRIQRETGIGIPLLGNKNSNPLRIKGEIYRIPSDLLEVLDFAYGNGLAYQRTKANILVPSKLFLTLAIGEEELLRHLPRGSIKTLSNLGIRRYTSDSMVSVASSWMYIARKDYWGEVIDGGYEYPKATIHEPVKDLPWLSRYYKYPIDLNRKE